ncbi:MAG: carbonic anhydrase family protein [Pirellulaceae bacterium]|nr:carbonic anhydrase family protein [Planctomycetales bacterium]
MDIQSPINIQDTIRATSQLPLRLKWCGTSGFLLRGEHGAQVVFPQPNGSTATLAMKEYVLRQFHFHHPSEHFLGGKQFDGELHLVHQDLRDCSYFVLGIFLSVIENSDGNRAKNAFFDALLHDQFSDIPTNPNDLIPAGVDTAYRYQGSLTTPPYSETVSWVLLKEPLAIPRSLFGKIFGTESDGIEGKSKMPAARPLQPSNGRFIIEHKFKF